MIIGALIVVVYQWKNEVSATNQKIFGIALPKQIGRSYKMRIF